MMFCSQCGTMLRQQQMDERARQVCPNPNCGYVHWDNPVPVVAALVQLDEKYVIARNRQWPEGIFSLITGYLEKGETVEQAVVREVEEELALKTTQWRLLGHYSYFRKNQLIIGYWIKATGSIQLNDELAETKLLTQQQLLVWDFGVLEVTKALIGDWKKIISNDL